MSEPLNVSIVMPVYNDWHAAEAMCRALDREFLNLDEHFQIILVDDGSEERPAQQIPVRPLSTATSVGILELTRNVGHYGRCRLCDCGWMGRLSHRFAEAALLACAVYWYYPSFPTTLLVNGHRSLTPLALPGAERIRLTPDVAALYQQVTAAIRRDCDTFVTMPGFNSFYFWTGKEPLTGFNATAWMTLFDDRMQQRIVDRLAEHRFACVLYSEGAVRDWMQWFNPKDIEERPLVKYIRTWFYPVGSFGGVQFMIRKDRQWRMGSE